MKAFPLLVRHFLRLIYRDRNTRIYGVLLPLVLFPAVLFLAQQGQLILAGLARARPERLQVHLPGEEDLARELARRLQAEGVRVKLLSRSPAAGGQELLLTREEGEERLLLTGPRGEGRAERLRARVRRALAALRRQQAGGAPLPPLPRLEVEVIRPAGSSTLHLLSRILPLILMVIASLGALLPAVEVTAAERERGTAETTLLLPVTGAALAAARLTAVFLATLGAVALNLAGMLLSAGTLFTGGEAGLGLTPGGLALTLLLSLVVVLFFSALLLVICAPARGFREAQAFAGPVTTLAFLPGAAALFPGLDYTVGTALIPLVNLALGLRASLLGEPAGLPLALTLALMLLLSLVLLLPAAGAASRVRPTRAGLDPPGRRSGT